MKRLSVLISLLAVFIFAPITPAQAIPFSLDYDQNTLTLYGASGVIVNNVSYSVAFMDGTDGTFNGLFPTRDLAFTAREDALAASQALIDQVFITHTFAPYGYFDANPFSTNGFHFDPDNTDSNTETNIFTPYAYDSEFSYHIAMRNAPESVEDYINFDYVDKIALEVRLYPNDPSAEDILTFAVWTKDPENTAPVPEPSTVILLGSGLFGLAWYRKRRNNYFKN